MFYEVYRFIVLHTYFVCEITEESRCGATIRTVIVRQIIIVELEYKFLLDIDFDGNICVERNLEFWNVGLPVHKLYI
jgi:hypothetical protein